MIRTLLTRIVTFAVLFGATGALADHGIDLTGRTATDDCNKSAFANSFLFHYFPDLQEPQPSNDTIHFALEKGRAIASSSNRSRPDTLLLQLYAQALRCNDSNSPLVSSLLELLKNFDEKQRLNTSAFEAPGARLEFEEVVRALKLAAPETLRPSQAPEQRAALAKWLAARLAGDAASKGPHLVEFHDLSYPSATLELFKKDGKFLALLDGHNDVTGLFKKRILGLGGKLFDEVERKYGEAPLACGTTQPEKAAAWPAANERQQVAQLYKWQSDALRECGPSAPLVGALNVLAGKICRTAKDAELQDLACALLAHQDAFVPLPSQDRLAFASQLRAQARAIAAERTLDVFTPRFEAYLTQVAKQRTEDPKKFTPQEKASVAFSSYLLEDATLPNGKPNPGTLYSKVLGVKDGRQVTLAQTRVLGGKSRDGSVQPREDFATRPGRAIDANYRGLKGVDAQGNPLPVWWQKRPLYHEIDGVSQRGVSTQAIDYVVASAFHADTIDKTEVVYKNLNSHARQWLRADLIKLYRQVSKGDYSELLNRYPGGVGYADLAKSKDGFQRAIANLLLWLDAPAGPTGLTAEELKKPYRDFVTAEAAASKPNFMADGTATGLDEERDLLAALSAASGGTHAGIPAPIRARFAKLSPRERLAIVDAAKAAVVDKAVAPYVVAPILSGGETRTLAPLLEKLQEEQRKNPNNPALRSAVLALQKGYQKTPPLVAADYESVRATTIPPFSCPAPDAAKNSGGHFTEVEIAFLAADPHLTSAERDAFIAGSDPLGLQSLRCRLAGVSLFGRPPGFNGNWPLDAMHLADRLRDSEAAISRAFLARLNAPDGKQAFTPAQLDGRIIEVNRRWAQLQRQPQSNDAGQKAARKAEEDQLSTELAALASAKGVVVPEQPRSGLDYVKAAQFNPRKFSEWVAKLPADQRRELAAEVNDLGTGGYQTVRALPSFLGKGGELANFREAADHTASLINLTLPQKDHVAGGLDPKVIDARREEFHRTRQLATNSTCTDPKNGDDLARFFHARSHLSDSREEAARNEFRRQARPQGEPDFGPNSDLLRSRLTGKTQFSSDDIDRLVHELSFLPTYELERLLATLQRRASGPFGGNDGLYSILREGLKLDESSRALLTDVVSRYVAARQAPEDFAKLAASSFQSAQVFASAYPAGQDRAIADYFYFLAADARALSRFGCPSRFVPHFENIRVAVLAKASGLSPADQLAVQHLWTIGPAELNGELERQVKSNPQVFLQVVHGMELARTLLSKNALSPTQDPHVERTGQQTAEFLVKYLEPQLQEVKAAAAAHDWKKLAELRDRFQKDGINPLLVALAQANEPGKEKLIPEAVGTRLKGLLEKYLPEANLIAALQNRDRSGIYAYAYGDGANKQVLVFKPNPKGETYGVPLATWQAEAKKKLMEAKEAVEAYDYFSDKAGKDGFLTLWKAGWKAQFTGEYAVTKADRTKNIAYKDLLATIAEVKALGVPYSEVEALYNATSQVTALDTKRIGARTTAFTITAAQIATAPLAFIGTPAFATGAFAGRLLVPIAVGAGIGGGFGFVQSIVSQNAAILDAVNNGRKPPAFSWKEVLVGTGTGAVIGATIGGLSKLPILKAYAERALLVYGTEHAIEATAVNLKDKNFASAGVEAITGAFPFLLINGANKHLPPAERPATVAGAPKTDLAPVKALVDNALASANKPAPGGVPGAVPVGSVPRPLDPRVLATDRPLGPTERVQLGNEVLAEQGQPKLTAQQEPAVLKAHEVGQGELGLDGKTPAGFGNYTPNQRQQKFNILREAGLTKEQAKVLLDSGVAGEPVQGVAKLGPKESGVPSEVLEAGRRPDASLIDRAVAQIHDAYQTADFKPADGKAAGDYRPIFSYEDALQVAKDISHSDDPKVLGPLANYVFAKTYGMARGKRPKVGRDGKEIEVEGKVQLEEYDIPPPEVDLYATGEKPGSHSPIKDKQARLDEVDRRILRQQRYATERGDFRTPVLPKTGDIIHSVFPARAFRKGDPRPLTIAEKRAIADQAIADFVGKDAKDGNALVVSDFHLFDKGGVSRPRFDQLLAVLRAMPKGVKRKLIILGDIIDAPGTGTTAADRGAKVKKLEGAVKEILDANPDLTVEVIGGNHDSSRISGTFARRVGEREVNIEFIDGKPNEAATLAKTPEVDHPLVKEYFAKNSSGKGGDIVTDETLIAEAIANVSRSDKAYQDRLILLKSESTHSPVLVHETGDTVFYAVHVPNVGSRSRGGSPNLDRVTRSPTKEDSHLNLSALMAKHPGKKIKLLFGDQHVPYEISGGGNIDFIGVGPLTKQNVAKDATRWGQGLILGGDGNTHAIRVTADGLKPLETVGVNFLEPNAPTLPLRAFNTSPDVVPFVPPPPPRPLPKP